MMRRSVLTSLSVRTAALVLATVCTVPGSAAAQLARPRVAAPDAPKLLAVPFQRDAQDSALSLVVADGLRDRLRANHLDKFNTIPRNIMNENLVQSGFPPDVPLDASTVRNLVRFLNARYLVEGSMQRRRADSVVVVARLSEGSGTNPQTVNASVTVAAARLGSSTGADLANRLVEGYRSFSDVQECRRALEQNNHARALQKAADALRDYPNSSSAYLCIASVQEAQNAPADTVLGTLRRAFTADTLNSVVMRRLASRYQASGDTTNLVVMLRRILSVDFRDTDLRISTARLLVQLGQLPAAIEVIDEGLQQNPASLDLLGVKMIAMGAASRWDSAAAVGELIYGIDTSKADSAFIFRETNYYRAVPDTTNWMKWIRLATQKYPDQAPYWYTLGELAFERGDTVGAIEAARRYSALMPQDGRGYLASSRYFTAAGMVDSALAKVDQVSDSAFFRFTAPIYLQAGLASYRDSLWTQAIERLQKAKDRAEGRAVVPAAFFLGLSQVRLGVTVDAEAEATRVCETARRAGTIWAEAEQNIIAGAAQNRDAANQLLSQVIPAYKQRAEAFTRNNCR